MELELLSDLLEKIDRMVEFIGFNDRKELIKSSILRFLDRFETI